jgi:rod shape-determining protein MreD
MVRGLISFVAVSVAVIVQLTIVDRIAFPGGAGPDVVLLAVAALALASGPMTGVLIGFWAGLALDVAPPGSHFVGQNALVFCLIGYACGLAVDAPNGEGVPEQGHTALFEIVVTALGAVLGEALASLLGAMLSDPRVGWPSIRHVLPVAVVYDVLLCPFVLYAAAAVLRLAGAPRGERDRAAWSMPAPRTSAGAAQGAIRQVTGGNTPRLRLAERGRGEGLGGGALRAPAPARREPRLKLGGGALGAGTLGGAAFAGSGSRRGQGLASGTMAGALGGGAAKVKFGARRGGGSLGGAMAMNSNLARSGLSAARFGRSQFGRSLLGGSVFSHSPSALRPSAPARKSAAIGRSSFLGRSPFLGRSTGLGRSNRLGRSTGLGSSSRSTGLGRPLATRRTASRLRSSPGGSATGYAPRLSRPGVLARLTGALRGPARRQPSLRPSSSSSSRSSSIRGSSAAAFRQPLRGSSLRGSSPLRGKSPGRGWLRRSAPRGLGGKRALRLGAGPTRLHMPRPRAKKRWRTGGYR